MLIGYLHGSWEKKFERQGFFRACSIGNVLLLKSQTTNTSVFMQILRIGVFRHFDTAGKLFDLALFERIFIVKTSLNHARSRGLPAVSTLVNDALIKMWLFFAICSPSPYRSFSHLVSTDLLIKEAEDPIGGRQFDDYVSGKDR